ncbi:MAG: carboxypeptidase regulatory-like domain-containing protein [Myxococcales bacterium]|nr:carboxypeptidase regulatory-like domain-containing protein [Myxococcales bacterium]
MTTVGRILLLQAAALLASGCSSAGRIDEVKDLARTFDSAEPLDFATPCENLKCQQVECGEGEKTILTGSVFSPKGDLPLYNAIVYVPNAPLDPFKPGVICDKCGAIASGAPIVTALTDFRGKFTLENVPAGDNIPLVLQIGRWRRKVVIPHIEPCATTTLKDVNLQRLARNKTEGDIPQMAIATGSADPFECLLRKVGIADSEITLPTGKGRVHFFKENGRDMNPAAPPGTMLYSNLNVLKKYDIVMLPCEGSDKAKAPEATQNMIDYTSAGGRIFTTHYGYVWIFRAQSPWPLTGDWKVGQSSPPSPFLASVDTSFPKGMAFSEWLLYVGASTAKGKLNVYETRHDLNTVKKPPSQRWIYGSKTGAATPDTVQHFTFNTPVNPPIPDGGEPLQCGRVVFSDFHVSAQALSGQQFFPTSCKDEPLNAQEKALAFMLFDLSSCVQKDEEPPVPPIP